MSKNNGRKKMAGLIGVVLGTAFVGVSIVAKRKKDSSNYANEPKEKNPMEGKRVIFVENPNDKKNADGVCGHLEAVGDSEQFSNFYQKYIKRGIDIVLSFFGLVFLAPVFAGISLAIYIDDPGPVLFVQKRLGQDKKYFKLHKFRSMKMSTPHDVPTHMLVNPERYITKVGKFIRSHSLDELPQIWDIFVGNMSVVGPRPGLWNQDVLTAERDKYGANDVKPGLTGWAQINGRDELKITEKARLDGEYVEKIGLGMDIKCFLGSIGVFARDDSVVEGGTGEIRKKSRYDIPDVETQIGFRERVNVDYSKVKRVLIAGENSYIGGSFAKYAEENYGESFIIDTIDMIDGSWREKDFSGYDTVFHVAGIAHADVGKVSEEIKNKYYSVNTDLAIETANKAKREGVKQFVFMSSMIIYGDSAPYGKRKVIKKNTQPNPSNFYGDSKWQADKGVRRLADDSFNVLVLRTPMIYGKGSKGNYPLLARIAKKVPMFPDVNNQRSMLYIDNLCEFLCQVINIGKGGIFFPQNSEYIKTTDMVREISAVTGKKIIITKLLNPVVWVGSKFPGKIGVLVNKAFGNCCYEKGMDNYNYNNLYDLSESIIQTEKKQTKAIIIASVASMIDQFSMDNIDLLRENGYKVSVACNFIEGNTISEERVEQLKQKLEQMGVTYYHIPLPRRIAKISDIIKSYRMLKSIFAQESFSIMHCHSPIGAAIARIASMKYRSKGMKVIYTAHGFHFYNGASLKNWLVFYPIERLLANITDVLITINTEDFEFARKKLNVNKVMYVEGVGIEVSKFKIDKDKLVNKREEIGISDNGKIVISVGELNENKNHEVIIRALGKLAYDNIHYVIAGKGNLDKKLSQIAKSENVKLHLIGYRTDICELLNIADVYAFPSHREGLSVALMEAMAAGLPCVVSRIRGNVDLITNGKGGLLCNPDSVDDFYDALKIVIENDKFATQCGEYNREKIKKYDKEIVRKKIRECYFDSRI